MMTDQISHIDTAFIIVATGLVMFMTPGLALFYGGLVRERAAVDMMLQNMASLPLISILWYCGGFSMAFSGGSLVGSPLPNLMYNGLSHNEAWPATTISGPLFATYQMMFAIITPVLMTGAFADRMYFGPFCVFIVIWTVLVYIPWTHQVWGGGVFMELGVWDFAGGIPVHTCAGWSSLGACLALGRRKAKRDGIHIPEPHSMPMVITGTGILWFGWLGFNGGAGLKVGSMAVGATINSQIAASMAVCVWGSLDWLREGKAKLSQLCIACVAGLVVITPMAGYVSMNMAMVVGVIAGTVCYSAILFLNTIGVDDALDVWGVHGVGGAVGSILIGVMADGPECLDVETAPTHCVFPGSVAASSHQVLVQTSAVVVCIVWSTAVTFILIKVMGVWMRVRTDDSIFDNLDEELHGESCYNLPAPSEDSARALLPLKFKVRGASRPGINSIVS